MFKIYLTLLLLCPLAAFSQLEIGPHGIYLGRYYDVTLKALYNTGNKQFGLWGQHVAAVDEDEPYAYRSAGVVVNFLRMGENRVLGFYNSLGLGGAHTYNVGYGAILFGKFGARVGIGQRVFICAEAGVQCRTVPWNNDEIKPLFEVPVTFGANYKFGKKDKNQTASE